MTNENYRALAHLTRSGQTESVHFGSAALVDSTGQLIESYGAVEQKILPRSAVKPIQALAMVDHGFELQGEFLALALASHSGSEMHINGVKTILSRYGLNVSHLRNVEDIPLGVKERLRWQCKGRLPNRLAHNCSGKHASMLATCVINNWPVDNYLEASHPMQHAIASTVGATTGEATSAAAVDGCGAPTFGVSVLGLAKAMTHISTASDTSAGGRIRACIRAHPLWVGGSGRPISQLLRSVPGIVAKDGAEGICCGALPDGRAFAVKVIDGSERAIPTIVYALIRKLGYHSNFLNNYGSSAVMGGGKVVGHIESLI